MNRKLFLIVWLCVFIFLFPKTPLILEHKFMAITESTFHLISQFEGVSNKAYKDSKGLWTIGVGHLIKPNEPHLFDAVLTDEQVEELFKSDLKWCEDTIASSVRVPLNQNQYDALYSLCFNIGPNGFKSSSVVRHLNESDYVTAANHILDWCIPSVLKKRREKEKELFLTPI